MKHATAEGKIEDESPSGRADHSEVAGEDQEEERGAGEELDSSCIYLSII